MPKFSGFPSGKMRSSSIPSAFFTELLPAIDHLGELKVTLYSFWCIDHMEGKFRCIAYRQFVNDRDFMVGLGSNDEETTGVLNESLKKCVARGTLLAAYRQPKAITEAIFFLNTVEGRAAVKAFESGKWHPDSQVQTDIALELERPNIFQLYEQNIGPLTPLIAEDLKQAEQEYPAEWIQDAIHIAIRNNVRRWKYIETILKSWHEKGRNEENRRNREEDRGKYIQGDYGDLIKH